MLLLLLVSLLIGSGCSASSKNAADEVFAVIASYGRERLASVWAGRGGPSAARCFERYIPQISALAEQSRDGAQACTTLADSRKEDEMEKVKDQSTTLKTHVATVQNSLQACSNKSDVIEYLWCLKTDGAENALLIADIAKTSGDLYTLLNQVFATIERDEDNCIQGVITKAKQDTDSLYEALRRCLLNGLDDTNLDPTAAPPVTEPQPEPETSTPTELSSTVAPTEPATSPGGKTESPTPTPTEAPTTLSGQTESPQTSEPVTTPGSRTDRPSTGGAPGS